MKVEVKTSIIVNGKCLTSKRLDALAAIEKFGSKTAAAKKLGVSAPVVHRYISLIEQITESKLTKSTATGTELTTAGMELLEIHNMMKARCTDDRAFTISCSPITENLVTNAISRCRLKADVIISDDYVNINSLKRGYSDIIVLDDPQHLEMVDNYDWSEIGYTDMVHVDNGPSYIKYKYGAQRIAYAYLDLIGRKYEISSETCVLSDLIKSKKSFFVDEILLLRKGIKFESATDKKLLRHSILAVYCKKRMEVTTLLKMFQSMYCHLR